MISDNYTTKNCTNCGYRIMEGEKYIKWLLGETVLLLHTDCARKVASGIHREVCIIRHEQEEIRLKRLEDELIRPF